MRIPGTCTRVVALGRQFKSLKFWQFSLRCFTGVVAPRQFQWCKHFTRTRSRLISFA